MYNWVLGFLFGRTIEIRVGKDHQYIWLKMERHRGAYAVTL